MKYKFNFGTEVANIPAAVGSLIDRAGLCDLKTILYLSATSCNCTPEEIAPAIGASIEEVNMSLAFWRGAGVIVSADEKIKNRNTKSSQVKEKVEKSEKASVSVTDDNNKENKTFEVKKLSRSDKLPEYTPNELANILEKRSELALLITEGEKIFGKIFAVHEVNILTGLGDYLNLDVDYILMLMKYCKEIGKKTLHYVEKTAISLYDMGITSTSALAEEIERREALATAEGYIRKMFGIGSRAFTPKELKIISSWVYEIKCPQEVIQKAYEVTCDSTGKATLNYANTVIERWRADGLLTIDEIEKSYQNKNSIDINNLNTTSSFKTDEFFEAAVRRSLGEK